jgi:ketosteroid isomerase-like protein
MGEAENRRTIDRFWDAITRKKTDEWDEIFTEDYVQEWPQSGERIVGRDNARAIVENYPGVPTATPRRTVVSGDLGVGEVALDYDGKIVHGVSIFEFRDGKIARETDYFADPFVAPEWRSKWVAKM